MCHDLMLDSDVCRYYCRLPLMPVFRATPTERQLTESLIPCVCVIHETEKRGGKSQVGQRIERMMMRTEGEKREEETRQRYA